MQVGGCNVRELSLRIDVCSGFIPNRCQNASSHACNMSLELAANLVFHVFVVCHVFACHVPPRTTSCRSSATSALPQTPCSSSQRKIGVCGVRTASEAWPPAQRMACRARGGAFSPLWRRAVLSARQHAWSELSAADHASAEAREARGERTRACRVGARPQG